MLSVWRLSEVRTTMDIDMLGKGSHLAKNIIRQIQDIILTDVVDDGLLFDVDSLQTQSITEDTDSPGIRVTFLGKLNTMRIKMQIDIGFGDVVFPTIEKSLIPTLLDFPAPMLLCYSRETLIAEKFEAMVKLGGFNTRMKDFYDIWLLSRQYNFTKDILATAIRKTFAQRGTAVPMEIKILSMEFAASKQSLWASFRKRLQQDSIPEDFYEVVAHLKMFLEPYLV